MKYFVGKKKLPFGYFSSFMLRGPDQSIYPYKNTATSRERGPH
jgi:hypothetical protein